MASSCYTNASVEEYFQEDQRISPFHQFLKKLEPYFCHPHFIQFLQNQVSPDLPHLIRQHPVLGARLMAALRPNEHLRSDDNSWDRFNEFLSGSGKIFQPFCENWGYYADVQKKGCYSCQALSEDEGPREMYLEMRTLACAYNDSGKGIFCTKFREHFSASYRRFDLWGCDLVGMTILFSHFKRKDALVFPLLPGPPAVAQNAPDVCLLCAVMITVTTNPYDEILLVTCGKPLPVQPWNVGDVVNAGGANNADVGSADAGNDAGAAADADVGGPGLEADGADEAISGVIEMTVQIVKDEYLKGVAANTYDVIRKLVSQEGDSPPTMLGFSPYNVRFKS